MNAAFLGSTLVDETCKMSVTGAAHLSSAGRGPRALAIATDRRDAMPTQCVYCDPSVITAPTKSPGTKCFGDLPVESRPLYGPEARGKGRHSFVLNGSSCP